MKISSELKNIYKNVWEIKQKAVIYHAVVRSYFVDQSQSMNLFFPEPDTKKLSSALLYGWKSGLKTGMYYLRTKPATNAIKFTIDANKEKGEKKPILTEKTLNNGKTVICNEDEGICLMCSG
jgi:ribonucleotide reductase alpha subunit